MGPASFGDRFISKSTIKYLGIISNCTGYLWVAVRNMFLKGKKNKWLQMRMDCFLELVRNSVSSVPATHV